MKEQKGSKEKTPIYNSYFHQTLITRTLCSPRKYDNFISPITTSLYKFNFFEIFTEILKKMSQSLFNIINCHCFVV